MTARVALTYQDYAALPDDGKRYEIRDGATEGTTKRGLYARYGVPYFWLVDPDARVIEAYVLRNGEYAAALRASGTEPVDLPPFAGLGFVPSSLWP